MGLAAAQQPELVQWLPGDEFEPARIKAAVSILDGNLLFAGRSDLHPVYLEPMMRYPPIARQVRVSGTVFLKISVAEDGTVTGVDKLSGHALLAPSAKDIVLKWRFERQSGEVRSFVLKCEFTLPGYDPVRESYVSEPPHMVIETGPGQVNPSQSQQASC